MSSHANMDGSSEYPTPVKEFFLDITACNSQIKLYETNKIEDSEIAPSQTNNELIPMHIQCFPQNHEIANSCLQERGFTYLNIISVIIFYYWIREKWITRR